MKQPARRRADKDLLSRAAWLDAAADVVAESGFAGLRVLTLAARLGVTRGSFYWHFKDREDLVSSVLDEWLTWRKKRSASMRAVYQRDDPRDALRRMLHVGFGAARYSPRGLRIEVAVRDLAATNEYAARALAESDHMRHEHSEALFFRLCGNAERARLLARTTYLMIAGSDLMLQGRGRNDEEVAAIEALAFELLNSAADSSR